jgi:hypothetical protein
MWCLKTWGAHKEAGLDRLLNLSSSLNPNDEAAETEVWFPLSELLNRSDLYSRYPTEVLEYPLIYLEVVRRPPGFL